MNIEHLRTLPTQTLVSLAGLTAELRAKQYLRALTLDMLRSLLLECERKDNDMLYALVRTEIEHR